jgi:hypothetical protein
MTSKKYHDIDGFTFHKNKKSFTNHHHKNEIIKDYLDPEENILIGTSLRLKEGWFHPFVEGYETIIVLMKSTSKWGMIGPYELRTKDENIIFENYWQFSKVYDETPKITVNQYGKVLWEYKKTSFFTDTKLNEDYIIWRRKGFESANAIRYPVYKRNAHKCIGLIPVKDNSKMLNYVDARKEVYFKEYIRALEGHKLFHELQAKLKNGKKLLISELDVCKPWKSGYYLEKYDNLKSEPLKYGILNGSIENIKTMANDTKNACGHGFPLVLALKGITTSEEIDDIFNE